MRIVYESLDPENTSSVIIRKNDHLFLVSFTKRGRYTPIDCVQLRIWDEQSATFRLYEKIDRSTGHDQSIVEKFFRENPSFASSFHPIDMYFGKGMGGLVFWWNDPKKKYMDYHSNLVNDYDLVKNNPQLALKRKTVKLYINSTFRRAIFASEEESVFISRICQLRKYVYDKVMYPLLYAKSDNYHDFFIGDWSIDNPDSIQGAPEEILQAIKKERPNPTTIQFLEGGAFKDNEFPFNEITSIDGCTQFVVANKGNVYQYDKE